MAIRWANRADATGIADVHINSWKSAYRNLVPYAYLDSLSPQKSIEKWTDYLEKTGLEDFCFVSVDDLNRVVGFISGGPNRNPDDGYDGEIYALYLLKEFQRRGIGKALFRKGANWLADRNYDSLILWVLKENTAVHFYEALGGKTLREKKVEIGGAQIVGISYVWKNIKDIAT